MLDGTQSHILMIDRQRALSTLASVLFHLLAVAALLAWGQTGTRQKIVEREETILLTAPPAMLSSLAPMPAPPHPVEPVAGLMPPQLAAQPEARDSRPSLAPYSMLDLGEPEPSLGASDLATAALLTLGIGGSGSSGMGGGGALPRDGYVQGPGSGNLPGSGGGATPLVEREFGTSDGPFIVKMSPPIYPKFARKMGKEGRVLLSMIIDESGKLLQVQVLEKAGYGFDEAAVEAVQKSLFKPALLNGRPICCRARLPIRFRLEDAS